MMRKKFYIRSNKKL